MLQRRMVGQDMGGGQLQTLCLQGLEKQLGLGDGRQSLHGLALKTLQGSGLAFAVHRLCGQLAIGFEAVFKRQLSGVHQILFR